MVPQRGAGRTVTRGRSTTAERSASTRSPVESLSQPGPPHHHFHPNVVRAGALVDCDKNHSRANGTNVGREAPTSRASGQQRIFWRSVFSWSPAQYSSRRYSSGTTVLTNGMWVRGVIDGQMTNPSQHRHSNMSCNRSAIVRGEPISAGARKNRRTRRRAGGASGRRQRSRHPSAPPAERSGVPSSLARCKLQARALWRRSARRTTPVAAPVSPSHHPLRSTQKLARRAAREAPQLALWIR